MPRRRRKPKVSTELVTATINGLSHEGRGVTVVNGKTVFVANALPGETVTFQYTREHNKYAEAVAVEIENHHSQRVQPPCEYFGVCGGCQLQHMDPNFQISHKQNLLLEQLKHFGGVEPETVLPPLTGPTIGYRRKARLGVRYVTKKERVLIGFREQGSSFISDIDHCEILYPKVSGLIPVLAELIVNLSCYKTLPQIEVAVGDETVALVLRHLETLSDDDSAQLKEFAIKHNIYLYLQPGKPDSVHALWPEGADLIKYTLPAYDLTMQFHPLDFTQINHEINQQLTQRAIELLEPQGNDHILDLFCGLGNFSLPLAKFAEHVTGIEGDQRMVERAQLNAAANGLSNVNFMARDLAQPISLAGLSEPFNKVLIDPPRSGALDVVQQLPQFSIERIVYVSCNPATLARDAGELREQGYCCRSAGIIDMFPHTKHAEAIAVFERI